MRAEVRRDWEAARPGSPPFETACVAPWVSLEFDPAGLVYGCCTSQLYPLGRIGDDRLVDLWNGERAQVLRESLKDWDLTVGCGPCRWHLEHGRMDPVAAVYDRYPLSGEHPATPHMMLFALSNRCNLACVMCNAELSSRIRAQQQLPPLASPYDDQFFEDLAPMLGGLRLAKFLGGEPFLAPEHRRIWDLMAELDDPPQLDITTNGTVWSETVERVLDRFSTDISISIDAATPETYAAVRVGGDLDLVKRNIGRFRAATERTGSRFHVSYCLMQPNWTELGAFLRWADDMGTVASVNLVTDEGLGLHDLPLEDLREVRDRWSSEDVALAGALELNGEVWRTQLDQLDAVIAERTQRRGATAQPRQSLPVPAEFFDTRPGAVDPTRTSHVEDQRARLERWAAGGVVAELELDASGAVRDVSVDHRRLGVDGAHLSGRPIRALLDRLEEHSGLTCWAVEYEELPDRITRCLVLSRTAPLRGSSGVIVRTLELPTGDGSVVLIAEDRFYDRRTPVSLSGARPATGT